MSDPADVCTTELVRLFVPGHPIPQERAGRRWVPSRFLRPGHTRSYDPAASASWKRTVAIVCGTQRTAAWPWPGPVWGSLEFFVVPTAGGALPGDVDNLAKAVLDALRRLVYRDDVQIRRITLSKDPATRRPGVAIHLVGR